jgi:hypothetical protein
MLSERPAATSTVVSALAWLLAVAGSGLLDAALALLVIVPAVWGLTLIVALTVAPSAMFPMLQVTVPDCSEQLPCDALAESNATPEGNVSVIVTSVAFDGPPLLTVRV